MVPSFFRPVLALACTLAALAASGAAQAQLSARDLYEAEQTRLGKGAELARLTEWQYETTPLSAAASIDFSMASGYIDAAHAGAGDVAVVAVRNQSDHAYCLRPKMKFTGKVTQLQRATGNVLLPAHGALLVAQMRVERRTQVVQHVNAAFWPAPPGRDPHRCNGKPPAGLQAWLDAPGLKAFPGNRVATTPRPVPKPAR